MRPRFVQAIPGSYAAQLLPSTAVIIRGWAEAGSELDGPVNIAFCCFEDPRGTPLNAHPQVVAWWLAGVSCCDVILPCGQ